MKKFTRVCLIIAMVLAIAGVGSVVAGGALGGDWKALKNAGSEVKEEIASVEKQEEVPESAVEAEVPENEVTPETSESSVKPEEPVQDETPGTPAAEDALVYSQNDVKRLEIEMLAGKLDVLVSEDDNIYVQSSSDKNIIKAERGSLFIKADRSVTDNVIQVYLPAELRFTEIDIDQDAGEILIAQMEAEEIDLDAGAGSILAEGLIKADRFGCSVEAGKVQISLLDAQYAELDCEVGELNANLAGTEADYKGVIECSMGNVLYGTEEYSGADVSKRVGTNGSRNLEAECEMGNVQITFADAQ